jgi:hypothetical protein
MILGALAGFLVVLVWWLAHALPKTAAFFFLLLLTVVAIAH